MVDDRIAPGFGTCPGRDETPALPPTPVMDSCTYMNKGQPTTDYVSLDTFNPDKFKHGEYRYQLFAKPNLYNCNLSAQAQQPNNRARTTYRPAYTDVRALEQTMYIPIVPSNPGGQTDVTFPMTPQTMGQPDVTSACCVPVIPSQPGFKNLSQGIMPGPCTQMNGPVGGAIPWTGGAGCPYLHQMCGATQGAGTSGRGGGGCAGCGCGHGEMAGGAYPQKRKGCGCAHCAPQTIRPPSNVPGCSCQGFPDTFPASVQLGQSHHQPMCSYANRMAPIPTIQPPHYSSGDMAPHHTDMMLRQVAMASDGMPSDKICTSASMIRHRDRMNRAVTRAQETPTAKRRRMREVYGHYGAYLLTTPYQKRHDIQIRPDIIQTQGNGFRWEYPLNQNRQCYVLSRNNRYS